MDTILVTGANGFVGRHLIEELLQNNYKVIAVGGSQVTAISERENQQYMTLDLMKKSEVQQIDFTKVSGVIHLAGMAAVGPSFEQPLEYLTTNVGIEINLFEASLSQNATPRFLIISSGTLYKPDAPQPLNEDSPILANSPYAVSKLGQEQMAQYYTTRGFTTMIARPFNHIGPGQGPGFIVPDLAQQIVAFERGKQEAIKVGNLDAKRDYTDVRDIVRAYRLLLEKGASGESYNICSGKPLSGHEILRGLLKAAAIDAPITQDPAKMRPSDTATLSGSFDKLKQATGWEPSLPLHTTLADVIAYWREQLT